MVGGRQMGECVDALEQLNVAAQTHSRDACWNRQIYDHSFKGLLSTA